jgi:hypothetical protein
VKAKPAEENCGISTFGRAHKERFRRFKFANSSLQTQAEDITKAKL